MEFVKRNMNTRIRTKKEIEAIHNNIALDSISEFFPLKKCFLESERNV